MQVLMERVAGLYSYDFLSQRTPILLHTEDNRWCFLGLAVHHMAIYKDNTGAISRAKSVVTSSKGTKWQASLQNIFPATMQEQGSIP